jgi:urea transport system substrate-binding protein
MASLRAFLREPLAGFLLIGALFFALHGALREDVSPVTLSSAGRAALYADFRALMGREPTDAERAALVREYYRDEVLHREALREDLARVDAQVRSVLIDRMRQRVSGELAEPTARALVDYYAAHLERYRSEARISFEQRVYAAPPADAQALLRALAAGTAPPGIEAAQGSRFPAYGISMLRGLFGQQLLDTLQQLPLDEWHGPYAGPSGWHVFRVMALGLLQAPGAVIAEAAGSPAPLRVGVLHSLSGTMAISETTLKDTVLMLVEAQNARGGLLGRPLEAVVVDPASDWPLFAEKARELLVREKVDVVFGCWTSVSRKSVLPVFEELNGLLFYPVQYEGEESSENVFYTGAAPNQQAIPAVDYLRSRVWSAGCWWAPTTSTRAPRTRFSQAYLRSRAWPRTTSCATRPSATRTGRASWPRSSVSAAAGRKTAVVSTVNGDANVPFYKELANQGVSATDIPVIAFSVGEEELSGIDTAPLVGHLAAWNYFMSVEADANYDFIDQWLAYIGDDNRVTNDPMEAHYIGFSLWAAAVEKAGSADVEAVKDAIIGLSVPNLSGGTATMLPNHHITSPC